MNAKPNNEDRQEDHMIQAEADAQEDHRSLAEATTDRQIFADDEDDEMGRWFLRHTEIQDIRKEGCAGFNR